MIKRLYIFFSPSLFNCAVDMYLEIKLSSSEFSAIDLIGDSLVQLE